MIVDENERDRIENESNTHTEAQITQKKAKKQASPLVIKCQGCQTPIDVHFDKLSPNCIKNSCCNGDKLVIKVQAEHEYILCCSCNCLSLAEKTSTAQICCSKPDCSEVTKEQHVCCIHCAHPFRFYSLKRTDHCSHCTLYSKFVRGMAEVSFFIISLSAMYLFTVVPINFVYDFGLFNRMRSSPDEKKLHIYDVFDKTVIYVFDLLFFISFIMCYSFRCLVGELERPFTMRDLWQKFIDNSYLESVHPSMSNSFSLFRPPATRFGDWITGYNTAQRKKLTEEANKFK